jgi:outer membrane biosynthesis protein TonB
MSQRHDHHGASTIRASRGGGGGKWILGALAVLLLAGGGYWAYANYGAPQQQAESQFAYDDPIYSTDDPLRDTSDASDDGLTAEIAADAESEISPSTAAPPSAAPARRAAPARATPARAEPVPEATIGVTPINATTADVTESEELVITAPQQPTWSRTPSARRLSALYPERALERGREGEARLACVVQEAGALDCERVSETPGGFGNAALRVARTFRHTDTLADGSSAVGSPVNLRVVFRMEDEERDQRFASR